MSLVCVARCHQTIISAETFDRVLQPFGGPRLVFRFAIAKNQSSSFASVLLGNCSLTICIAFRITSPRRANLNAEYISATFDASSILCEYSFLSFLYVLDFARFQFLPFCSSFIKSRADQFDIMRKKNHNDESAYVGIKPHPEKFVLLFLDSTTSKRGAFTGGLLPLIRIVDSLG